MKLAAGCDQTETATSEPPDLGTESVKPRFGLNLVIVEGKGKNYEGQTNETHKRCNQRKSKV